MLKIIFIALLIFISLPFTFAQDAHTLDKIIVRQNSIPAGVSSTHNNYPTEIITAPEIKEKNPSTLVDLLNYVSGMDLRYRGTHGIQGDLSLRGSGFEEVAILIDGIKVIDPQTGHHNLDIPLTAYDIERVEVIKEGSSSLYGAGAFSGSVNIVTKKPSKKTLNLDALFGEHALFGQGFSFSLPQENFSSRVSFEHQISSGARPNTDFEYKTGSFYINKEWEENSFDILFGYQKKDFGADSFYSNLFPEEEEHTETIFTRTGLNYKLYPAGLKNNLYFRRHKDKFILRRNNPSSVNYHTTYVYGVNSGLDLPTKFGDLSLDADTGRDEIYSTNLGKHTRIFEAGSIGFIPQLPDRLTSDIKFRSDHYQKWGWEESYNFGLGYFLIDEKLKIKCSASRAFRIPSFTELYYSDAANKGNPNLGAERSDNFVFGLDFKHKAFQAGLDGFLRKGRNLIDWTRTATSDPWQATNLGQIDFTGIEFNSKLNTNLKSKYLNLENVAFSYNYTHADKKASGFYSKYALDILKHQYLLDIYTSIVGLNFNWQLSYNQRYYGETYFVGNIYIGKRFTNGNLTFEPFLKMDNFSNAKYTEVAGVLQPGRWIKSGLKFEW
jgi:iron complex outermembrane receptor protein